MKAKSQYVPIREVAAMLKPSRYRGKFYMALLQFYCDESYDSQAAIPKTYVIAGFLAPEDTWARIADSWDRVNRMYEVERFHASHLNARTYEFEGWSTFKKNEYGKRLSKIITKEGTDIIGLSFGILADEYYDTIDGIGREQIGSPYSFCFRQCIVQIALMVGGLSSSDRFSVILDRNPLESEAVEAFYGLKDLAEFECRDKLVNCAPGSWEDHIELQPADMIAYESFKYLQERRNGGEKVRKAVQALFDKTPLRGRYFDKDHFKEIAEILKTATCGRNGFIARYPGQTP